MTYLKMLSHGSNQTLGAFSLALLVLHGCCKNPASLRSAEAASDMQQLEVRYTASGPRPRVNLKLQIGSNGWAELTTGTSESLANSTTLANRIGRFAGSVDEKKLAALRAQVIQHKLLSLRQNPRQPFPETVVRTIGLAAGATQTHFSMVSNDNSALVQFEELLMEIARSLALHPVSALELEATVASRGTGVSLRLTNIGSEPIQLIGPREVRAGCGWSVGLSWEAETVLPSGFRMWTPVTTLALTGSQIGALATADAGLIVPGGGFQIALPGPERPASEKRLRLTTTAAFCAGFSAVPEGVSVRTVAVEGKAEPPEGTNPPADPVAPPSALELQLFSSQSPSGPQDPLAVTIWLHNRSQTPVTVCGRLLVNHGHAPEPYRDLSFDISGPPGYEEQASFRVKAGECQAGDFVLLAPGARHTKTVVLTNYYSLHQPGRYTIVGRFLSVTAVAGRAVWLGRLESTPLIVERR